MHLQQSLFATHYPTGVFETRLPWPVRVDLPGLTGRRARILRFDQA